MTRVRRFLMMLGLISLVALPGVATAQTSDASQEPATDDGTYSENEILEEARGFFGATTEGLAEIIEKAFEDNGRPNAYIVGEEASGAIGVGVRYGEGTLNSKLHGTRKIYWQGPSIGWDLGGNASRVFTLVYDLPSSEAIFQRFPGVEGSFYFIAGLGVNYQRAAGITLAPIRTGVGLRAGANVGYLHYTKESSWIPF
ncbi:DUF1134 domain-containing protein [Limibacillus halophilus]|uniref:DUF1134 domain-containing protein n=1 Tax=Limibacillus halophilus TaxID=1579333 RepID=A0A839STC3_9PROT|nr:DUF1134 domain-containing protein [Limibacillus halophilus]MBB3065239.1 hypothetical protein [Limibacillus halophilus]